MPFDLEVEFTGLCLYVTRTRPEKVTVLMPDCRRSIVDNVHEDNTTGESHAGYLRLNLANFAGYEGLLHKGNRLDGPRFEVVYQFDGQQLDVSIDSDKNKSEPIDFEPLGVPGLGTILGGFAPIPNLFAPNAPKELLFRTELRGGAIRGKRGNGNWTVPISGTGSQGGQFSEVITWKYSDIQESLVLTLSDFDGSNPETISLAPAEGESVVRLKVANLCSVNPLEWAALETHVQTDADEDFKWLYRLFTPRTAMPVPQLVADFQTFGAEGCLGGDDE
ncbi:MAG: hypothetical protein ACREMA_03575 [Longimicrobiales bacterium]